MGMPINREDDDPYGRGGSWRKWWWVWGIGGVCRWCSVWWCWLCFQAQCRLCVSCLFSI